MKTLPPDPIDLDPFQSILNESDACFRIDVSYAVAVSKSARAIASKREMWKLRLELREASNKAQKLCAKELPFSCETLEPCGLGTCKFAKGDLAELEVVDCKGDIKRPQAFSQGSFSLDSAAEPLRVLRSET